jgi:integrase
MFPFSEADLERVYARAVERDQRLADILLVDAWTGLRWSELRAIRVRDFVQVPMPVLVVQRAEPEGVRTKSTKSGRSRRVPVADCVLPIVRGLAGEREPDAPLFVTASGHRLHATALSGRSPGRRLRKAGAFTIFDIQPHVYGSRSAWMLSPSRPGWGTHRSQQRTSTCTTSEPLQIGLDWIA